VWYYGNRAFQARGSGSHSASKTAFCRSPFLSLSQDHIPTVLLLLLLRRLGSLILQLLNRLLRVVLIAAVGLDLYHKQALANNTLPPRAHVNAHSSNNTPNRRFQAYRALAVTSKTLVPFSLALLLLLQLLLLELLGLFRGARVCIKVEVSTGSSSVYPLAESIRQGKGDIDLRSWLSLPMVRGALAQKLLDAPMERDTGARRTDGLRRMEGIMCGVLVNVMLLSEKEESFQVCQVVVVRKSRGSGTSRMVFVERELSVKTGSKVDRWEERREERKSMGRNAKSLPKHYQLPSYDVNL